jgi:hypothetical protein
MAPRTTWGLIDLAQQIAKMAQKQLADGFLYIGRGTRFTEYFGEGADRHSVTVNIRPDPEKPAPAPDPRGQVPALLQRPISITSLAGLDEPKRPGSGGSHNRRR